MIYIINAFLWFMCFLFGVVVLSMGLFIWLCARAWRRK